VENKTILVIEDNEINIRLVRSVLQPENYQIIEADNAENGIQLARDHHPDLILMDIQLPGMDGLQATRHILGEKNLKHIPIIALTGYAMDVERESALAAGCVEYITKPFRIKSFKETIAEFIQ